MQLSCSEQGQLQFNQVLRAPSSLTLNVLKEKASTTSLRNLCPCLTIIMSNLNLPSFNLKPCTLVLSQQIMLESLSFSFSFFFYSPSLDIERPLSDVLGAFSSPGWPGPAPSAHLREGGEAEEPGLGWMLLTGSCLDSMIPCFCDRRAVPAPSAAS